MASPNETAVLEGLARGQLGLISQRQLRAARIDRRIAANLRAEGTLIPMLGGVFRLSSYPALPEHPRHAALLWRPGAVISHRSAGALFGWDRVVPDDVDLSFVGTTRKSPAGVRMHTVKELPDIDVYEQFGLKITRPARTLIDLASVLLEEDLAYALESAWRKRWIAMDWLKKRLGQRRNSGLRGVRTLERLVADCEARGRAMDSVLEVRFWRWLRDQGLPMPVVQLKFLDDHGEPGRIDFAWPGQNLAVETRGWTDHGTRAAFERNALRTSRLSALGWRVMPVTWRMLDSAPGKLKQLLLEALGR